MFTQTFGKNNENQLTVPPQGNSETLFEILKAKSQEGHRYALKRIRTEEGN